MNKQQLIDKLYKQLSSQGISYQKWELNEIVEPFLSLLLEELKQGNNISLINFGKFVVKTHKSRPYYNINKGQTDQTKERRSVEFTPHRSFHRAADPE